MRIRLILSSVISLSAGICFAPFPAGAESLTRLEYAEEIMGLIGDPFSVMAECGDESGREALEDRLVSLIGLFAKGERIVAMRENANIAAEEMESRLKPYADLLEEAGVGTREHRSRVGRIKHGCPTTAVFLVAKMRTDSAGTQIAGTDWVTKTDREFFETYNTRRIRGPR